MTTLTAWGPTLVMLLAVLVAVIIGLRVAAPRTRRNLIPMLADEHSRDALTAALDAAEIINRYDVASLSDPRIHLGAIIRLAPAEYQGAALEIPRYLKGSHVVSVDLSLMNVNQAARLVDFCSGLLAGTSGWLFRATDRVIVLTPIMP